MLEMELNIFTHGKDAYEIAKLLPSTNSRVVNRGERHAVGGLNPEFGIPQSGSVRFTSSWNEKNLSEDVNVDYECEFFSQFENCQEILRELRFDAGCEFEIVLKISCTDETPVLQFGNKLSSFLASHNATLSILTEVPDS